MEHVTYEIFQWTGHVTRTPEEQAKIDRDCDELMADFIKHTSHVSQLSKKREQKETENFVSGSPRAEA